ncbi:protein PAT1 like protein 1 [Ditylenchus destructor]|uniref:Protein PAT1 like protein 1 n=1 Tax=Ditylenchus destructor TaxID=166010 RepID=A0AAD4RB11_9BILA|nr:protein PAT1 like protein 1 [Ditylenchus destructor]
MDLQPFFDDDPALNQEHLQFDDTTDSDNCREEEEEQEEYDAINDETFGGELNALDESGLEEFANRTAGLFLEDVPQCDVVPPDPSQIPMPQVNSIFCKGSYDKIWDNSAFPQMDDATTKFLNRITEAPSPLINNNNEQPKALPAVMPGAKTLEEIEREALGVHAQAGLEVLSMHPPNVQTTPSPFMKPAESALSLEELEKRMLMEAAMATASRSMGTPSLPTMGRPSSQHSPMPPPGPPPWHRMPHCPPPPLTSMPPPPPGMQFPPPFPFPIPPGMAFPGQNPGEPPRMLPPAFLHYLAQHGAIPSPPPMLPPFQGPPPPIPNMRPPGKPFNGAQRGARNAVRVPVPGSWMRPHDNRQHNGSPYQVPTMPPGARNSPAQFPSYSSRPPRQKGLPSGRTISDFAFDPYAGFMSKKEREWLIKIHLIQCTGTGDPMDDDFYYTIWKKRNVLAKAPDEWKVKLQPKYYNFDDTYPSAPYVAPSFSGTLGRPTHCSANYPRQMIELSMENADEDESGTTKNTQKKLKAILMRIENAAMTLLKCEEMKRKLPLDDEEQLMEAKLELKQEMDLLIASTCTKDSMPTIMLLQKGRVLLFRILGNVLQQSDLYNILNVNESVKNISAYLGLLDKGQMIDIVKRANFDKDSINTTKLIQLTLVALLANLAKFGLIAEEIPQDCSLYNWLESSDFGSMPMEELEQIFRKEDLVSLKKWLAVGVAKKFSAVQKLVESAV